MPESEKMLCPNCGAKMNHHADKLDITTALTEPDAVEPELGGILEKVYSCPKCGKTVVQRAT